MSDSSISIKCKWKAIHSETMQDIIRFLNNPWVLYPVEEEAHDGELPEYFVKPQESEVFIHVKDSVERFLTIGDLIEKFK